MQKSKKIMIYISIAFIAIVMLSLFYYSMRATLIDYFFENNQGQREKITSASGEQSQIMVDLATKQLAKQQVDSEIRQNEDDNKSLFKELNGNKATIDTPITASDTAVEIDAVTTESEANFIKQKPNKIKNGFVVVDCDKGGVIACPHYEVQTGTSPLFYQNNKSDFLVGRCVDVSIDVKTFCH